MMLLLTLLLTVEDDLCRDLLAANLPEPIAIGPLICPPESKADCDALGVRIVRCFGQKKVATKRGAEIALDEHQLSAITQGGMSDVQEIGQAYGAKNVVIAQAQKSGASTVALIRVIAVDDGRVVAATRATLSGDGSVGSVADKDYRDATARLTEALARGYLSAPGKTKRVAVMPFVENGELSKKNGIGTLVSAEIVTLLRRDWRLQVVERSRLQDVMKEIELGQYGAVDAKLAPRIGGLLNADAIILGSVNDAGDKIAVSAQVIDTLTGLTVMAESVQMQSQGLISLASDAVVLRSKSGALFRSLLIPGWGQVYNRQPVKGGIFSATALALAGAGATMFVLASMDGQAYARGQVGTNFDAIVSRIETYNIAGTAIFSALAAFWIINVIDAYVSGVTFDSAVAAGGGASAFSLTPAGGMLRF